MAVSGHRPERGSDVEEWIKKARDLREHPGQSQIEWHVWHALNDLLDDYRLHADTGTPLGQEVSEHETG
jgi:hypothetical protein